MARHHDLGEEEPRRNDAAPREYLEKLLGLSAKDLEAINAGRPQREKPDPHPAEQNVSQDRYDGRLFDELCEASPELRALAESEKAPETFPALLRDFFCAFYKAAPALAPEDAVDEHHLRSNRSFVEGLLGDEKTGVARLWTRLDPLASGLATLAAGRRLLEEMGEEPENPPRQEQPPPAREEPGEDPPPEGTGTGGPPPEGEADEGGAPNEDGPDGDAPSEDMPDEDELKRVIRAAAGEAAEEAEDLHGALSGWGLSPADLSKVPLGERLELARRLRGKDLRRLTDLVGRMRRLAAARRRREERESRDEVHSVTLGGDPARVLPAELAAGLASRSPARRRDFYRRLSEGQVLSHEMRAEEPSGRGPVVALIDASGSMSGQNMEWAVAVALALVEEAVGGRRRGRPRRRASVLFFNSRVVREVGFEPRERNPRKLLEIATVGADGGTDYRPALTRAVEIAGGSRHEGADLLLVTDALFRLPEAYVEELASQKRRLGFKLYSVLIGAERRRAEEELGRYSEEVWAADLSGGADGIAGSVFGRIS